MLRQQCTRSSGAIGEHVRTRAQPAATHEAGITGAGARPATRARESCRNSGQVPRPARGGRSRSGPRGLTLTLVPPPKLRSGASPPVSSYAARALTPTHGHGRRRSGPVRDATRALERDSSLESNEGLGSSGQGALGEQSTSPACSLVLLLWVGSRSACPVGPSDRSVRPPIGTGSNWATTPTLLYHTSLAKKTKLAGG